MGRETVSGIREHATHILRFAKKDISVTPVDFGYSCLVGDKAIRIYPNNLVEIADLEYIREEEDELFGMTGAPVGYTERPSWATQYPVHLSRDEVKASIDFAFMSAGLPSLFYLANLYVGQFATLEEQRVASLDAFKTFYPEAVPTVTELNAILRVYGRDLYYASISEDRGEH